MTGIIREAFPHLEEFALILRYPIIDVARGPIEARVRRAIIPSPLVIEFNVGPAVRIREARGIGGQRLPRRGNATISWGRRGDRLSPAGPGSCRRAREGLAVAGIFS